MEIDAVTTLCLACLLFLLGEFVVKHVSFLQRICIPPPVIGGLLFAILVAVLDTLNIIQIKLDASFIQDFFMMVFFTTIGLGASFKLFKIGGKILILYFVCCAFLAICQNFIGISLAKVLHIKPLLGLTAGSMSMEGGHGNALMVKRSKKVLILIQLSQRTCANFRLSIWWISWWTFSKGTY